MCFSEAQRGVEDVWAYRELSVFEMFLCVDILLVKIFKEWFSKWDNKIVSSYLL